MYKHIMKHKHNIALTHINSYYLYRICFAASSATNMQNLACYVVYLWEESELLCFTSSHLTLSVTMKLWLALEKNLLGRL